MALLDLKSGVEQTRGGKKKTARPAKTAPASFADEKNSDVKFAHVKNADEKRASEENRVDFRNLPDPQRTLERVIFLLKNKNLKPAFRIAAAILVKEFEGNDTHYLRLKMSELLPDAEGYTTRTRTGTLDALKAEGLIEKKYINHTGMDITLLF